MYRSDVAFPSNPPADARLDRPQSEASPAAEPLQDDLASTWDALNRVQAIIQFDLKGIILDANENFLAATGYTLNEIQGQHHRMFCDPKFAQSAEYQAFWQTLGQGKHVAGEFKRLGKGERPVYIQASYTPVLDPHGKVERVVKFATDVTAETTARHEKAARNHTIMSEMLDRISSFVEGIDDISKQTNLLSLNATIEAARASTDAALPSSPTKSASCPPEPTNRPAKSRG